MLIYLADLGHNQLTLSSDVYPLGIANLAAYATAYLRGDHKLDIRLFREPQDLKAALERRRPDLLALSSYSWNHQLSLQFARYGRRLYPGLPTVMGGPNYPLSASEKERFLRTMPEIAVAVRGPTYEGERAFLNFLQRFADAGLSLEGVYEESIPGCDWIDPRTGAFVSGPEPPRIQDLDEIPSPYLNGWLKDYYSTGYFPMMQINRGCPFSCTFCNSAPESNSKIYGHSLANVQADLLHLAQNVRPEIPLCFADDNFGMYPIDVEVADYIGWLQERYGWPNYIRTTTGKNRGDRIIQVMRKVRGKLPMTAAVQSLNPQVLVNIKRSNIKLSTYAEIQKEVRAQGMQSYGELILGLPGETKESFLESIRELMRTGAQRISAHQLMLLHGAPMAEPESRRFFRFDTRFRLVARNLGKYLDEPVFEVEEMVIATPALSFADYLECRVFHLLLTIFYYEGNFEEFFAYLNQVGIEPFAVMRYMQSALPSAPPAFRRLIEDFVTESQEELFPTPEACLAWARENFDGLVSGEKGGNLLSKYSMLGRFYHLQEALRFLRDAIQGCAEAAGRPVDAAELESVLRFLSSVSLHVPFEETLERTVVFDLDYDVPAWVAEGYARPLRDYRLANPMRLIARASDQVRAALLYRVRTFGEHPSGLGKFTRTLFARDLRREVRERIPAAA